MKHPLIWPIALATQLLWLLAKVDMKMRKPLTGGDVEAGRQWFGAAGYFAPFDGSMFVAEFTDAKISRVFPGKMDGEYQGSVFQFLRVFARVLWSRVGRSFHEVFCVENDGTGAPFPKGSR